MSKGVGARLHHALLDKNNQISLAREVGAQKTELETIRRERVF